MPPSRNQRPRTRGPVALTGTPGSGKTAVARALRDRYRSVEVADLALAVGAGRRTGRTVEVDLARLRRRWRTHLAAAPVDLVVGHLAHLLPIRDIVVLRCRPIELERRLARARRGSATDRRENAIAEATDVVLCEAARPGRRVWEIDATARSVSEVARAVRARLRHRGPSSVGRIDWLADPAVTAHLLDRPP
jgi:adenylate kinase